MLSHSVQIGLKHYNSRLDDAARVMAEELKGNVFELRRTCSLSAKPLFPHVFPERGHVPGSAAHAARLISHSVKGLLDACVDDPREAHGARLKRSVKNQPFHPPWILLFPVLEPLTFDLIFIPVQQIHLSVHVTAEVWSVLSIVSGFHNFTGIFADQACADASVSFSSPCNSLTKRHKDEFVIRIPRIRDIGVDTLLQIFDAGKWKGHVLSGSYYRGQEQTKKGCSTNKPQSGMRHPFHSLNLQ